MGRKKTGKPTGHPITVGDIPAREELRMRVTLAQKADIYNAISSSGAGTLSEFVRTIVLDVSEGLKLLKEGKLTPEDFKRLYGEVVYSLVFGKKEDVKEDVNT